MHELFFRGDGITHHWCSIYLVWGSSQVDIELTISCQQFIVPEYCKIWFSACIIIFQNNYILIVKWRLLGNFLREISKDDSGIVPSVWELIPIPATELHV